MLIVLSQKIDTESAYQDKLFNLYHFPKRYRNQIHEGDIFVYYQGNRSIKEHRYYYGVGKIGMITCDGGENYYAELVHVTKFERKVPIYLPEGGYIEELGYETVRRKKLPPWQSSIRHISETAFTYILSHGMTKTDSDELIFKLNYPIVTEEECADDIDLENSSEYVVEIEGSRKEVYTTRFERKSKLRRMAIIFHGTTCMVCGFNFSEIYGERGNDYIEVHHIKPLADNESEVEVNPETDLVVVCSNCHRMIHRKRNQILSIEELKSLILETRNNKQMIYQNSGEWLCINMKSN